MWRRLKASPRGSLWREATYSIKVSTRPLREVHGKSLIMWPECLGKSMQEILASTKGPQNSTIRLSTWVITGLPGKQMPPPSHSTPGWWQPNPHSYSRVPQSIYPITIPHLGLRPHRSPSKGHIWILATTECYTKWVETVALPRATRAAIDNFICDQSSVDSNLNKSFLIMVLHSLTPMSHS